MEDWLTVFPDIIQRSCQPVCMAWLENVLCLENSTTSKLSSCHWTWVRVRHCDTAIFEKIGHGEDCCYDNSIFLLHGVSILEDLVITLADGIASIFLELISVDGNLSNEMNSLGLALCTLSTRALQRLRNEVQCLRYYFSLLLELSDISMPLIKAVISKVSDAISFFLVIIIYRISAMAL
nr:hypothetical protein CFP56_29191 [Quercus suber]